MSVMKTAVFRTDLFVKGSVQEEHAAATAIQSKRRQQLAARSSTEKMVALNAAALGVGAF